jgi:signal transduction histidine kinase
MILNTIRNKVLLYFIAASAVVIGIYGYITYNLIKSNLETEMGNRLITAGEIIAEAVNPKDIPLLKLKGKIYDGYREKLSRLRDITEVRDILVIDESRSIILSTLDEKEKFFLNLDRYEIEKAFEGEVSSSPLYKGSENKFYKTGYVPLGNENDDVTAVIGVEASAEYTGYIEQYSQFLILIGLLSFAIALGLSLMISRGITRNIGKLKDKAEQIAKRNFSENIQVSGEEEINVLGRTLESMKKELEEYIDNREKMATVGEFSAGVAHEIRNSLGALSGYAELIREKTTDEKIKKYSGDIVKNSMKMSEFLNNFLAYTKEFTPEMHEATLSKIADDVYDEMPQAARQAVRKNYSEGAGPVKVDTYLVKKALYNIIMNAYQALDKPGGTVEVTIVKEGAGTAVIVKDNGRGIPPDKKEKIFQPFYTGRKEGTGLGLAISYRIIKEIHGGEITVESEQGKGTEVKIIL